MINKLLLLLLLSSYFSFGQIPEKIIQADTLYFYFDHSKFQKRRIHNFYDKQRSDTSYAYTYEICYYQKIILMATKYKYISEEVLHDVKKLKKSFLRKNKDIVITIDDIIEYGMQEFVDKTGGKVVYVIDTKRNEHRKLVAREATYFPTFTGG